MYCNTGTSIERVVAVQFATDTGANLSLHDLSVRNLSADYDHFLDCKSIMYNCVDIHVYDIPYLYIHIVCYSVITSFST